MNNINLIFFGMPQSIPLVKELGKHYSSKDGFDVRFTSSVESVSATLEASANGIFIFKVENKKDLTDAVGILKGNRKLVKKGLLKPACISKVKSKKVDKILSKYGCMDILEPNITPKTLSFKIDFWTRSINTIFKKLQAANENLQVKSHAQESTSNTETTTQDFVIVDPLDLQSDIWLLKSKADYKKILRRWLVRLLGPSPHAGNWVELEPQPGDKEPSWKFVLRKDEGQFVLEDGAWFFYGSKPDFDWKIQRWIFSSNTPHLYFYSRSGEVYSRVKYDRGQLIIARNSEYAQMKEAFILATCESKYEFQNDDQQASPKHHDLDGDNDELGGHYEGEANTENLDQGPMVEGIRADLNDDSESRQEKKLASEQQDLGGSLAGKSHTDHLDHDPMSGKAGAVDEVDNNWGGKSSTDELDRSPLEGKSSTDELDRSPLEGKINNPLSAKEKREEASNAFSEDSIDGNLQGKGSTDELDRSPLEGKVNNPLAAKEKREEASKAFSEEAIDGTLRGKSSTDELDHSPLEGKVNNPLAAKEKREEASKAFSEEAIDGNFRGKSSTDELDRSPLEGKVNNPLAAKEKREEASNAFSEDSIDGDLQGEGSIDELDRSPLEGKVNNPLEAREKTLEEDTFDDDLLDEEYTSPLAGKNIQNPLAAPEEVEHEKPQEMNQSILKGNFKGSDVKDGTRGDVKKSISSPLGKRPPSEKKAIGTVSNPFGGKRKRPDADIDFSEDLARLGQELPVINDGVTHNEAEVIDEEDANSSALNVDMLGATPKVDPNAKESELDDILGGGLTEGAYNDSSHDITSSDDEIDELDEKLDFEAIIGEGIEVNTESGDIKVVVKQETKNGNHITFLCQFDDFFENELMVRAPKDSVNTKSNVSVSLTMKYNKKKINVDSVGTIVDVENDTDGPWDLLVIELNEVDEKKIDQLMSLYAERQENIHVFMQKAKGL